MVGAVERSEGATCRCGVNGANVNGANVNGANYGASRRTLRSSSWRLTAHGLRLAAALIGIWVPNPAIAQPQPRIEADGVPGKPYGIGVLTIQMPPRQRIGGCRFGHAHRTRRPHLLSRLRIAADRPPAARRQWGREAVNRLFPVHRRTAPRSDPVDAAADSLRTDPARHGRSAAADVGLVAGVCSAAVGRRLSAVSRLSGHDPGPADGIAGDPRFVELAFR